MVSVHESLSKNPLTQDPSDADSTPAIMCRGSYGVFVGLKSIVRVVGSADGSEGDRVKQLFGTYDNHLNIALTPSWSSSTCMWLTPFGIITCGPPS
jgi:hypothetical protein